MNDGILVMLERMQTNPEDFAPPGFNMKGNYVTRSDTWRNLAEYAAVNEIFTEEERATVATALREVTRKVFTAKVLELLTAPHEYSHEQYATKIQMGSVSGAITDAYRDEMSLAVAQTKAALAERTMK